MMIRAITLSLCASFVFVTGNAFAANQQQAGTAARLPDLTQSCAKECPHAATNDDAFSCVENMENSQGEAAFKKSHRTCYNAHEKYERKSGKEEAGEANE